MKISKRLQESELAAASDVNELCDTAKQLEDSGEYAEAARALGGFWRGIGIRPDVDHLPSGKKAAILSRVGALTGWLGSMQQVPNSQEKAKDLISEAASSFEAISDHQNWAETRSDLAVCYWREGAFDEARAILHNVMGSGFKFSAELQGKLLLRAVNVEISTRNYDYAISYINQATPLIENKGSDVLRGKLYFHRALIMQLKAEDEGRSDLLHSAVKDYRRAAEFYQQAGHLQFFASVETNLGFLLLSLRQFNEAHLHFDTALEILAHQKDKRLAASVYDSKAQTFIAQGNLPDAELAALTSVKMLKEGGENATLAESLTTLAIVLNRGGNIDYAIQTFQEAKETALMVGDKESAGNAVLTYIEELQPHLTPVVFRSLYLEADELLGSSLKHSNVNRLQNIARKYFETVNPASVLKRDKYSDWQNFSLPDAIHAYERELILKALSEVGGRITKAARLLGVTHQSLSQILRQRHNDLIQFSIQRRPRGSVKNKNYSE